MRELSLFSGAGGGLLASKLLGWTTIGYVENDDYCQRIIAQRIKDGILDEAPIFGDIRAFNSEGYAHQYYGMVDIITAGFPCQPHSSAARGRNPEDTMLAALLETISIIRPRFVFAENVMEEPINRLASRLVGYEAGAIPFGASDLGADHIRERFWLFAYADNKDELCSEEHAEMAVMQEFRRGVWEAYPEESGVVNGLANWMDRTQAIGNGQVPIVAATAWNILSKSYG